MKRALWRGLAGAGIGLFIYGAALDFYRRVFWEGGAAALTLPEKFMFVGFGIMLVALIVENALDDH